MQKHLVVELGPQIGFQIAEWSAQVEPEQVEPRQQMSERERQQ